MRNEGDMGKAVKIGLILSQIWLSIIDKNKPILDQRSGTESSQLTTSWSSSLEL
jgi:hypothetical protein